MLQQTQRLVRTRSRLPIVGAIGTLLLFGLIGVELFMTMNSGQYIQRIANAMIEMSSNHAIISRTGEERHE
jgi:hypothetical protein